MSIEATGNLSYTGPLLECVVSGARVVMTSVRGYTSIIQVVEDDAPKVMARSEIEMVEQTGDRVMPGFIPLGRFFDDGSNTATRFSWSCLAAGPDIVAKVAEVVKATIKNTGAWFDVASFFRSRFEHDPLAEGLASQPPIRWSWLVGAVGHKCVCPIGIYEEHGLVMDPKSRLIHVFTSPLDALAKAREFEVRGVEGLRLEEPKCLGCFLSSVGKELGPARVRGAVLDGRWQMDFHTCPSRGPSVPSHVVIHDEAAEYHLVGCADRGWPRLAEVRWKGEGWDLDCGIGPW